MREKDKVLADLSITVQPIARKRKLRLRYYLKESIKNARIIAESITATEVGLIARTICKVRFEKSGRLEVISAKPCGESHQQKALTRLDGDFTAENARPLTVDGITQRRKLSPIPLDCPYSG